MLDNPIAIRWMEVQVSMWNFGNGDFIASEMKKIMASEKLADLATVDPKHVKRYGSIAALKNFNQ